MLNLKKREVIEIKYESNLNIKFIVVGWPKFYKILNTILENTRNFADKTNSSF